MSLAHSKLVSLTYGTTGRFSCEIDARRVVAFLPAPVANNDFKAELDAALAHPLDFPPMEQGIIPDDKVVIALDAGTPEAAALVAAVWQVLSRREIRPEDVVVIQPAHNTTDEPADPRMKLPEAVRNRMAWKIHTPHDEDACVYLATTTGGERVYLAREVVEADFVISAGAVRYDPVLGYRGTNSVFYPGLSDELAHEQTRGQGHRELGPDDVRPFRQLIDEIGWLLGTQFSVQVIPAAACGVSHVIAGAYDSVLRRGKELLAQEWLVRLETRPEIVVAAVDADSGGHGWEQVGSAIATARNLVARHGRILILSQLEQEPGEGLRLLGENQTPRDALQPLNVLSPEDATVASQIADAADWADVYLLSRLDSDVIEDLFLLPVENETEASRLLSGDETCLFLSSAQFVHGQIGLA